MIIGFEDVVDENDDELDMLETESKEEVKVMENAIDIASPAEGKAISLSEVADAQAVKKKAATILDKINRIFIYRSYSKFHYSIVEYFFFHSLTLMFS